MHLVNYKYKADATFYFLAHNFHYNDETNKNSENNYSPVQSHQEMTDPKHSSSK